MSLESLFDKLFRTSHPITEEIEELEMCTVFEKFDEDSIQSDMVVTISEYSEDDMIRMKLRVPEVLPCAFDQTVGFWLKRIRFWCRKDDPMNVWYTGPDGKKKKVSVDDFEDAMTESDELTRIFGKWMMYKKSVKSFEATREFYDETGKKRKETYFVDLNLDSDIENAFKGKY